MAVINIIFVRYRCEQSGQPQNRKEKRQQKPGQEPYASNSLFRFPHDICRLLLSCCVWEISHTRQK